MFRKILVVKNVPDAFCSIPKYYLLFAEQDRFIILVITKGLNKTVGDDYKVKRRTLVFKRMRAGMLDPWCVE
jgi:hypothetical protein